jgi:uncharacterized protein
MQKFQALALAASLAAMAAHAQAPAPAAPPKSPPASAPAVSPAKKALVAKVLQLQQAGIEGLARQLAEQPAMQILQQANVALQRLPPDRREQIAKDIQSDARKYAEEATPIVRERAVKLAPQTVGSVLEEKFTEDELKQVVALLESPVNKKFQSMLGEMQRSLSEKLIAETRPAIEPKVRALEQSVVQRLQAPLAAASGASSGKP